MSDVTWQEKTLVWLFRVGAAVTMTAFLTMVMPTDWMAATHVWLGLGAFPEVPITEYMARSLSMMYGLHGFVLLVISFDLRRHRPLVVALAGLNVVLGLALLGIDIASSLPTRWILFEGPPLTLIGIAMVWLVRGVPRS